MSGMVREERSLATISQSLWLLGLSVLLFPERIQEQTTLHQLVGTLAQVLADVLGFTINSVPVALHPKSQSYS